jgi:hypothetical protein
MHEFTWRSRQANRSIEIQRLRGVATTARALCDIHVTVFTVVALAVASDRMRSHTKKLPRIVHTTRDATNHLGSDAPLEMVQIETRLRVYCCLLSHVTAIEYTHCAVMRCAALYLSGVTCNDSVIVLLFRLVQLPLPRRRTQVRLKFSIFFANPIVMSRTPNPTTISREMMSQSTSKSESNSRSFILRVWPPVLTVQDSH